MKITIAQLYPRDMNLIFLLAAADKILGRRLSKMIFWRELMNCDN